ncbi:MAG TPA: hypothetical protein VN843_00230, partial [Anaerolineales bacterium]|nr:hypothetical protein [Anaerolineales bacterium]
GLMYIRIQTVLFGAGFFLFCGATHIGLALEESEATWVTITDHLQAVCIIGFIGYLLLDLQRASLRMSAAYQAIAMRYDRNTALTVEKTINKALHGDDVRGTDKS